MFGRSAASVSSSSAVVYWSSILIMYGRRLFWRKGLLKGRSGQRRAWGGRETQLVVFMFKISNWITLSFSFLHIYQPQLWTLVEFVCASHMRISPTGCQTSTLPVTLDLLGEVKLEQSICLPMSLVCFPLWHRNSIFLSTALTPHRPTDFLLNCLMLGPINNSSIQDLNSHLDHRLKYPSMLTMWHVSYGKI